jgi:protein-disulfide isomerase
MWELGTTNMRDDEAAIEKSLSHDVKMNITIPSSKLTLPFADRDHLQGPPDAPISIVEYGDYECLFCGEAHILVKEIQKRLAGRL